MIWHYSIQPKREGKIPSTSKTIHYFDPEWSQYKEISIIIPELTVLPPKETTPIPKPESKVRFHPIWMFIILGVASLIAWFGNKKINPPVDSKLWSDRIGKKRGFVLEHTLMEKGFSEEDAKFIVYITEGVQTDRLEERFQRLSLAEAKKLHQLTQKYSSEV